VLGWGTWRINGCKSFPIWETAPFGLASLLDMFDFSAHDFTEISYKFGQLLARLKSQPVEANPLGEGLTILIQRGPQLGLDVTVQQLISLMAEIAKETPQSLIKSSDGIQIVGGQLSDERMVYHIECLYSTLQAELRSIKFKAIPKEKNRYCDPAWLTDSAMFTKFPDSVDELQRAGRCFAYGENTACVFHLMRVTDFYLRKVADSLNITYDASNWHGIGEKIRGKMEQKYQSKTDEWRAREPLYAEILTDIQAIGRGHRNPSLHELEKKYDERETAYILGVIQGFARHVAEKL
jgi:hypothetical protein